MNFTSYKQSLSAPILTVLRAIAAPFGPVIIVLIFPYQKVQDDLQPT